MVHAALRHLPCCQKAWQNCFAFAFFLKELPFALKLLLNQLQGII